MFHDLWFRTLNELGLLLEDITLLVLEYFSKWYESFDCEIIEGIKTRNIVSVPTNTQNDGHLLFGTRLWFPISPIFPYVSPPAINYHILFSTLDLCLFESSLYFLSSYSIEEYNFKEYTQKSYFKGNFVCCESLGFLAISDHFMYVNPCIGRQICVVPMDSERSMEQITFRFPSTGILRGMTTYKSLLYICDTFNNQILVLDKKRVDEQKSIKLFVHPLVIHVYQDTFYVGDLNLIKIYSPEWSLIQILGDPKIKLLPCGIAAFDDVLYVNRTSEEFTLLKHQKDYKLFIYQKKKTTQKKKNIRRGKRKQMDL